MLCWEVVSLQLSLTIFTAYRVCTVTAVTDPNSLPGYGMTRVQTSTIRRWTRSLVCNDENKQCVRYLHPLSFPAFKQAPPVISHFLDHATQYKATIQLQQRHTVLLKQKHRSSKEIHHVNTISNITHDSNP